MSSSLALEWTDVTAGYGGSTVLRGISLTLASGTIAALLGPNGAGKSTLLRTGSGLLPVTSGTVRLHGEEVGRSAPHILAGHGLCHVPEGRGIFPSLTVRENVAIFAGSARRSGTLDLAVDAFPALRDRANQIAGTLSGGEQQMLALSRAWIQRPNVVLIDEPSLGLAPLIVDSVYEFLGRLAESGTAMLLVEQYVDMALALAHRVHVLVHGELVLSTSADAVDRAVLAEHYMIPAVDTIARGAVEPLQLEAQ